MHTVIETPDYIDDAHDAGLTAKERRDIVKALSKNPTLGALIKNSGGARKVRFAANGKGKSGGVRVITYYAGEEVPLFLLNVFSKGDAANLTHAEVNMLKSILDDLKADYLAGVAKHAAAMKGRKKP